MIQHSGGTGEVATWTWPALGRRGGRAGLSRWTAALLALLYALGLASLPLMAFRDRTSYLAYAEHSSAIVFSKAALGPLALLANEPVWLLVNAAAAPLLSPTVTVRSIIFLPAFVVAFLLLRADSRNWPWLLLFLLLPQVLKNHITHLRQGMAIAVFLLGWFSSARVSRWALMGLTPFIHASFFFVLVLHGLTWAMQRLRLAADLRSLVHLATGLTVGASLGVIAAWVGARQAQEYDFSAPAISGLGFVFWLAMLFIFGMQGPRFLSRNALAVGAMIFYLGTYFFVEVTARIFESVIVLALIAGLQLTGWRRLAFLWGILEYGALQWALKFNSSGTLF